MSKRKLVMTAEDDGTVVTLRVEQWDTIGSSQVGPDVVFEGGVLSFPNGTVEDWRRDMAVLIAERL